MKMNLKLPSDDVLLTRDQFRELVFLRDGGLCVNCKAPGQDSHHLLERRLWSDGGYYLANGCTVCGPCHILAEQTLLDVEELRRLAGITKRIVPEHLYPDEEIHYDKWGNIIQPNGQRLRGELFYDESVQKILKEGGVLDLYSKYVKYPRTMHLPYSPGLTDDDRALKDTSNFDGQEVVVSIKYDGENSSFYNDFIHARSVSEYDSHPSHKWAKILHGRIAHDIPEGFRLCCENVYAKHSIHYEDLESYIYLFSIWNAQNVCLSWNETLEYAELLGVTVVPQIYRGLFDKEKIENSFKEYKASHEGYVVRLTKAFSYGDFKKSVAKYVRKGHVQTSHFWKFEQVIENKLKQPT